MSEPNQLPAIAPVNGDDLFFHTGPQGIVNRMADSVLDVTHAQQSITIVSRQ